MADDLGAAVDAARMGGFVGRVVECAAVEAALADADPPRVFYLHGPGGMGKTTMLHRFRITAQRAGRRVISLDGRDIDCTPDSLRLALAARGPLGLGPVLLVDGYDGLLPLDGWFREEFVPGLPPDAVVVLAGREPPAAEWRIDPGWRTLARCLPVRALDGAVSDELLARIGVPAAHRPRLVQLSHGHPLTLALLAAASAEGELPGDLADVPDLVATLVRTLVGRLTDPAQVLACGLAAMAWLTTPSMVRAVDPDRADELWQWLLSRPFINRGPDGLYPHDLVRDVLAAELTRRSPENHRRIHRVIHRVAVDELRAPDRGQRPLWAGQLLFLHQQSPFADAFWVLRDRASSAVGPARPGDHPDLLELIGRIEGPSGREFARRWFIGRPDGLSVIRSAGGSGRIEGFSYQAVLPADPALTAGDPVLAAALDLVESAPARAGEQISVARFIGGRSDQRDPHVVLVASLASIALWLTRPLAWSFIATHDPRFWAPAFDYLGFPELTQVRCDGHEYTIFGLDWRRMPLDRWLELMADREITGRGGAFPESILAPVPLGRAAFDEAVLAALRELHHPDRLRGNPLAGARLADTAPEPDTDPEPDPGRALRGAVLAAIDRLGSQPNTRPAARVLDRTFVRAAPTREAAAEVLGLPFSTYRRHLSRALRTLTDLLWSVEVRAQRPARRG